MLRNLAPLVLGLSLTATSGYAAPRTQDTTINDVKVTAENGGINPKAFAYRIDAQVLVGSNACTAKGVTVELRRTRTRGVIHVSPIKRLPADADKRICTGEWAPVYKTETITVRGSTAEYGDVLIHNFGGKGKNVSVHDLLEPGAGAVTLTGVLDRAMGIGGESSGYALELPSGERIELDLATHGLARDFHKHEGQKVTVSGQYKQVQGTEVPNRRLLEATIIGVAD